MFQTRLECTRFTPPKVQGSVLGYSLNELDWKCGAGGIKLSGLFFLFKRFLFRELSYRNLWDPAGCIFLLTKLGGQFHGRFAVSTPYFLSFPVCSGFFQKSKVFSFFTSHILSVNAFSNLDHAVLFKGIDVPQSSSLVVSEPAALSVDWVWLPALQPCLAAVKIWLMLCKGIVHLLLVCAFISMRV